MRPAGKKTDILGGPLTGWIPRGCTVTPKGDVDDWPTAPAHPKVGASTMAYRFFRLAAHRACLGLLLVPFAAASCEDPEPYGSLTVQYRFAGITRTCLDADVQDVTVTLDGDYTETAPCDLVSGITLPSVPARTYAMLKVEGINASGITVLDNLGPPATDETVEVLEDTTQTIPVELSPTPAQLRFSFNVLSENGFPYAPQEMPAIYGFVVDTLRNSGTQPLLSHEFVYSTLTSVQNVPVPDPSRIIHGDDIDALTVDIIAQDQTVVDVLEFQFVPPGPGRTIAVQIQCQGQSCTGSVSGVDLLTE